MIQLTLTLLLLLNIQQVNDKTHINTLMSQNISDTTTIQFSESDIKAIYVLDKVKRIMTFEIKGEFEQIYIKRNQMLDYNYDTVIIKNQDEDGICLNYLLKITNNLVSIAIACDCNNEKCIVINDDEYLDLLKSMLILEQK